MLVTLPARISTQTDRQFPVYSIRKLVRAGKMNPPTAPLDSRIARTMLRLRWNQLDKMAWEATPDPKVAMAESSMVQQNMYRGMVSTYQTIIALPIVPEMPPRIITSLALYLEIIHPTASASRAQAKALLVFATEAMVIVLPNSLIMEESVVPYV